MSRTRRLAAILAADVAGYSRLMGADEEGTLGRLRTMRAELGRPDFEGAKWLLATAQNEMKIGAGSVHIGMRRAARFQ